MRQHGWNSRCRIESLCQILLRELLAPLAYAISIDRRLWARMSPFFEPAAAKGRGGQQAAPARGNQAEQARDALSCLSLRP